MGSSLSKPPLFPISINGCYHDRKVDLLKYHLYTKRKREEHHEEEEKLNWLFGITDLYKKKVLMILTS